MKELSIEQKAKSYDEALKKAKGVINYYKERNRDEAAIEDLQEIFPELKESEDERIRKEIISALKYANYEGVYDKHLAWLEKQGKQKPYGQREECLDCQFNYAGECKGFCPIKSEQKSNWSEEDETRLTNTIIMLKEGASLHFNKNDIAKGVDWLKYLKERVQPKSWKPSDKQMKALEQTKNCSAHYYDTNIALESLYNDLIKLI